MVVEIHRLVGSALSANYASKVRAVRKRKEKPDLSVKNHAPFLSITVNVSFVHNTLTQLEVLSRTQIHVVST